MQTAKNVDAFIQAAPSEAQEKLRELLYLIRKMLPDAEEVISYGIPTFKKQGKPVVYFSGYRTHVAVYPASDAMEKAIPDIKLLRTGKGTIQFPLKKPLPLPLIRKVIQFLIEENRKQTAK